MNLLITGGFGSGAWEKIADVTLDAPATGITVSGLDLDTDKAYMLIASYDEATGGARNISLYYNGDLADANYGRQELVVDGAIASAGRTTDARIGRLSANDGNLMWGTLIRDPDGYTRYIGFCNAYMPTSIRIYQYFTVWSNPVNVTSISVNVAGTNNCNTGSKLLLFRVKS